MTKLEYENKEYKKQERYKKIKENNLIGLYDNLTLNYNNLEKDYNKISNEYNKTKILYEKILNETNKKTIIGIDLGSTYSSYSIINDDNDNSINYNIEDFKIPIIPSELIMDASNSFSPSEIGDIVKKINKKDFKLQNRLFLSKFKKYLDPNNYNNNIEANIPKEKTVSLYKVFEGYLTLLRKQILDENRKNIKYKDNIKWVLTIPPLFDKKGHQFMRDIAYKVGMNNIDIALEPEAASLAIFEHKKIKEENITLNKGNSFIVVDAGGYTVDISAHKILDDNNNLEQLIYPESMVKGSNFINEGIIKIIEDIYGKEVIQDAINNDFDNWESTLKEIEEQKINIGKIDKIESKDIKGIKIPIKFKTNLKDELDKKYNCNKTYFCYLIKWFCKTSEIKSCETDKNITFSKSEIFIPINIIIEIINKLAEDISHGISDIYTQIEGESPNTIVLTGGFSECKKLEEKLKEIMIKKKTIKKIVFLTQPQETVAKGAAIYGVRPNQILKVRCPFTVVIETLYFSDNDSDKDNCEKETETGKFICSKNVTVARMQESVKVNDIRTEEIIPSSEKIKIFYLEKPDSIDEIELDDKNVFLNHTKISVSMKFSNCIRITIGKKKDNEKIIYYPQY